ALTSQHHPFTMPDRVDFDPADRDELLALKSRAYDLVINGEELGGGSIRIHDMEVQEKIFTALGLSQEQVEDKFGFFLTALEYGAPPHGGLALGLDRVIAMILKASSIREVIAFPKTRSAFCPLTRAPATVEREQLEELGLLGPLRGLPGKEKRIEKKEVSEKLPEPSAPVPRGVSSSHVRHIARLARLKLSDMEVAEYQKDLNAILDYVETLRELDTENIRPMSHVLRASNVWREDRQEKSTKSEAILSNAPLRQDNYFKVPKIIED
ncbi:MAG: Asp-tRNA(Asn)/Glu-tRNA(Gln) amidotransferase subunit GatC, partial [Deltaproteobacteria bacterium]|nr:Asp-tRNA(Asn)/Glu-tRNA(Gln) amidotransferase subunit GatC [Deltaproteobacteria bacterium]